MRSRTMIRLFAVVTILAGAGSAWAHIVYFKDGFTLAGRIKRDSVNVDGISVPGPTYYIDDEVRRFVFAQSLLEDGEAKNDPRDADMVCATNYIRQRAEFLEPLIKTINISEIDEKHWTRSIKYQTIADPRPDTTTQTLVFICPRYCRFDDRSTNWKSFYLTSELDPDVVAKLVSGHRDMKPGDDKDAGTRRLRYARFLIQCNYFDMAEKEIESILKDYTDVKDKAYELQETLKQARLAHRFEHIERAWKAGQIKEVRDKIKDFPFDQVDIKIAASAREIKAKADSVAETMALARKHLKAVGEQAKNKALTDATGIILKDVDPQTVDRLGPFLDDVQRAERSVQAGEKPQYSADELLAIAASGWLMGKTMANPKPENATALWVARDFLLNYQRATGHADRRQLLSKFRQDSKLGLDEIAHMINFLPPPIPEEIGETSLLQLKTKIAGTGSRGLAYTVQLPPEYHHGRAYPVLFALHDRDELPRHMIERIGPTAAQHGYILVAPEWAVHGKGGYRYSPEEHDTVLEVLRDLRWRFQVDSDRVCMTGLGDGANMTLDVGFSHPDVFAAIAPMAGQLQYYTQTYDTNCAYLPVYMVNGDQTGKIHKKHVEQFTNKWVKYGYPAIMVSYKGRADEWFGGELPNIFDWMSRKKRSALPQEIGRSDRPFKSLRPKSDNRFYWMASNFINADRVDDIRRWRHREPAKFVGKIMEGNKISASTNGMKQLTLWFTREMVDLSKPVQVQVNSGRWTEHKVETNLDTLLEDLFVRGDRQRLFMARVDITKLN